MTSGERRLVDAVARLPRDLVVDLTRRRERGIRISLPKTAVRQGGSTAERQSGDPGEETRLVRFGEGWAPPSDALPPHDPIRSLDYVVVDVETTGGSASLGDRITEVAVVRLDGRGAFLGEYTTLVNPERPIPPPITHLTRITQAMVARAPRFHEIAPEVQRVLEGAVFVAHNAAFDWRFLSWELRHAGAHPPRGRVLCTVRLARRVVPEVSHRSLDALQFFFDVENEARHRAFGDARATATIFRKLLDRVDEREIACWQELETLLARRAPRRKRTAMPTCIEAI